MTPLAALFYRWLNPPPPTTVDKIIETAIETGKTTIEVSELINEVLPEHGPIIERQGHNG